MKSLIIYVILSFISFLCACESTEDSSHVPLHFIFPDSLPSSLPQSVDYIPFIYHLNDSISVRLYKVIIKK